MPRKKAQPADAIADVLEWSPKCREHFLPWRAASAQPLRDNYIAEAGISDLHPGYRLGRTRPRFHLLVYTVIGEGTLITPETTARIEAGTVLVAPAHQPFGYRPLRGRWRFLWYHLRDLEHWRRLKAQTIAIRPTQLTRTLEEATEGFLREARRSGPLAERAAELYAGLIALQIERELGAHDAAPEHSLQQRLHDLWDWVNRDLGHPWSISELAGRMQLSPSHLHRICVQYMGMPPLKMVTRLRMERAQELLIMFEHPVRVIAEMVGYQNEFAFFTAFRRFAGVTPGQFRERR